MEHIGLVEPQLVLSKVVESISVEKLKVVVRRRLVSIVGHIVVRSQVGIELVDLGVVIVGVEIGERCSFFC